jgi:hypothetical protein
MANTVDVDFTLILGGTFKDSSGNPRATIRRTITKAYDSASAGASLIDQAYFPQTNLTLAAGATTTLDLTTGLVNPINNDITGAEDFAKVRVWVVYHEQSSAASSIRIGGASNPFGGLMTTASNTITLVPGQGFAFFDTYSTAGMAVSGSAKNVQILNVDGTNAATYRIYFLGSIS